MILEKRTPPQVGDADVLSAPRGFLNDPCGRRQAKGGGEGSREAQRAGSKSDRRTFTGVFGEC